MEERRLERIRGALKAYPSPTKRFDTLLEAAEGMCVDQKTVFDHVISDMETRESEQNRTHIERYEFLPFEYVPMFKDAVLAALPPEEKTLPLRIGKDGSSLGAA